MKKNLEIASIKKILEEANKKVKPKRFKLSIKKLRKFCEIIEEKNPIYLDIEKAKENGFNQIPIPNSYLLSAVSPITHVFFTSGIGEHVGSLFKAIIHTSSKFEILDQMFCETPYIAEMEFLDLKEKKGKMGAFFETIYLISMKDSLGKIYFKDYHHFFLKLS
ncbi:MAG: FAS1-like dehydratase domain-containing protein [Promethearchaeota archaeon]